MRTQAWEVYGLMAEEKDLKEQKAWAWLPSSS